MRRQKSTKCTSFFDVGEVEKQEEVKKLLDFSLNAVECLSDITKIIEKLSPNDQMVILNTSGTAAIKHLEHLRIERTGTALQLAWCSGDEDIIAHLKAVMTDEAFESQSKSIFKQALLPSVLSQLEAKSASLAEYYDAVLKEQEAEARKLCDSIVESRGHDHEEKLIEYTQKNAMHNPYILNHLFTILKDGILRTSGNERAVVRLAYQLSSPRWLQHYAQDIYFLSGGGNSRLAAKPARSFMFNFPCYRFENAWVGGHYVPFLYDFDSKDIRTFIYSMSIDETGNFRGREVDSDAVIGSNVNPSAIELKARGEIWQSFPIFLSAKNHQLKRIVMSRMEVACDNCCTIM